MLATESLLVMLPKRCIDDVLTQYSITVLGSRMEESGYLLLLEGEINNLSDFVCEVVNMEFFLAEEVYGGN